ncbi:MAG: oligosaccharyl transferase, archaeosortase A system-associated [Pedobacter sp.]|uniref:oligosaccharyl transferase, archaeosortase A system-associated n=1 Tax=Pedobacter sp. TaxID=1411316 RepID=UPI003564EEBC
MKKNNNKQKIKEENKIPAFVHSNWVVCIILTSIMALSFYIRGIIPMDEVFRGATGFAMDDAVFHMRLIENTIVNYPHRLTYDAFTNFPYGSVLSWGILFDFIIATLALMFGVENLNTIAAFVPAVMGALVVIPVYVIGKELYNKKAGIIAGFIIAILPGQFLSRSVLGFTDHHVAEVLFSTAFMACLIVALNRAKDTSVTDFLRKPLSITKSPLCYAVLAGVFLSAYILTWTTGILFAGIVALFVFLQIIVNKWIGKPSDYLVLVTIIVYGITALAVLPFVELKNGFMVVYYSPTHVISMIAVIVIAMSLAFMEKRIKDRVAFTSLSLGMFILILIAMGITVPGVISNTVGSLDVLFVPKTGGSLTIAEAAPTSTGMIIGQFGYNYILALLGLLVIGGQFWKDRKSKALLMVVWSIIMLSILMVQNRWSYYVAVNIAVLSGFFCAFVLEYIGWKNVMNIKANHVISLAVVIAIIGLTPFDIAVHSTKYGALSSGFYEWNSALTWMRNNTPDTGLDYYGQYERPAGGDKYDYPDTAYGVMSWWDYGHIITYWAHRIPNANPFQSGIGGGSEHLPGASTFLTAQSEEEANRVLDNLSVNSAKTRYVVSNAYMAYSIQPVFAEWNKDNTGYFQKIRTSKGDQILPSLKLYGTMESKLHIFDGNGLKNYRLIHESAVNPNTEGGNDEITYKQIYNFIAKQNLPTENSGYVKIFEKVPGARIVGKTEPNSTVTISNTIRTNIGREFQYSQSVMSDADGNYKFVVPYSTPVCDVQGCGIELIETKFDTYPIGDYKIGDKSVHVSEKDVIYGEIVYV